MLVKASVGELVVYSTLVQQARWKLSIVGLVQAKLAGFRVIPSENVLIQVFRDVI